MNGIEQYKQMLKTALSADIPIIGRWKAAQILYVVYKWGGAREEFTYSPKFLAEMDYIQHRYGINGAMSPDAEVVEYIQQIKQEQEDYEKQFDSSFLESEKIPKWANDLCRERYGFTLNNVRQNVINK